VNVPELPEVETVRRGLAPVMEGARFRKVEARRPDLRFPFPKDFAARLQDQTVTGLGRRAKYLLADLSSGDVLVMHLGMSGSFRIAKNGAADPVGEFHHPRSEALATITSSSTCRRARPITFNDPRRFGFMKLIPRAGSPKTR
jgi:formamidopyrimidine-DNA glycosylase